MIKSQYHIVPDHQLINSMGGVSRIQEMKNFENKLNEVEDKINQSIQDSSMKTSEI